METIEPTPAEQGRVAPPTQVLTVKPVVLIFFGIVYVSTVVATGIFTTMHNPSVSMLGVIVILMALSMVGLHFTAIRPAKAILSPGVKLALTTVYWISAFVALWIVLGYYGLVRG